MELKEKGIYVTVVCPGWIKTDLYKRAEIGARMQQLAMWVW